MKDVAQLIKDRDRAKKAWEESVGKGIKDIEFFAQEITDKLLSSESYKNNTNNFKGYADAWIHNVKNNVESAKAMGRLTYKLIDIMNEEIERAKIQNN